MTRRTRAYRRARQRVVTGKAKRQREAARAQQRTERFFADRWESLQYQKYRLSTWCPEGRQTKAVSCCERDTVRRDGERRHEPCRCDSGRRADRCCRNQPVYKMVNTSKRLRPAPDVEAA